jgi:AMIN domain
MHRFSRGFASRLSVAGFCACLSIVPAFGQASVRSVKVLGSKDVVEVEVEASDRIIPETQVLTGPDRLVIDFPNSRPSDQARSQSVDRGEVKDIRVGLFQSKPPVTRVVLDLKAAQSYQVFPNGRTVMIKVVGGSVASNPAVAGNNVTAQQPARPGLVAANYTARQEPVQIEAAPQPQLLVSYQNGMLGIHSEKSTLSEVLYAVQQRTGADIPIPAGAEQEKVAADLGPAPAPEVLARLLNGSKFNFLILSAANDPTKLDRVILSTRSEGNFIAPLPQVQNNDDAEDDEPAVVRNQPDNPIPPQVAQQPEQTRSQGGSETPDQ